MPNKTFTSNIDNKGYITLPDSFRGAINTNSENIMILTVDHRQRCLVLYPVKEWQKIEKWFCEKPPEDSLALNLKRLVIGHSAEVELNNHGQIQIPSYLYEFANISGQIVIIEDERKYVLWDKDSWKKHCEIQKTISGE